MRPLNKRWIYLQVEGRARAHPVQEFRTDGSKREGDDKGCAEQARGKININETAIAV